jgi:hypothetical protein
MTTIISLLDRVHAINQLIDYDKLTCYRYFPGTNAKFPFIVPLLLGATYNPVGAAYGGDEREIRSVRTVTLLIALTSPKTDVPMQTAMKAAESVIDPLLDVYYTHPYLEQDGQRLHELALPAAIGADTGIVFNEVSGLFEIRFTLTLNMIRSF